VLPVCLGYVVSLEDFDLFDGGGLAEVRLDPGSHPLTLHSAHIAVNICGEGGLRRNPSSWPLRQNWPTKLTQPQGTNTSLSLTLFSFFCQNMQWNLYKNM
jgi:hypothetical protein